MVKDGAQSQEFVSDGNSRWTVVRRLLANKKVVVVAAVSLLIVLMAGAVIVRQVYKNPQDTKIVDLPSQSEGFKAYAAKVKSQPPAGNASAKQKAAYYKELELALANTKDYQGAAQAFEQREKYGQSGLVYYDYLRAADYYYRLHNKTAALRALDRAEALLPPDDPNTGYSRSDTLTGINEYREALK